MNTFSEELKKEREAKSITLADIARKTRINIKYLEAIEQGAFDILPQTYVRAFIKAYADAVGLSTAEVLKKYEIHGPRQFPAHTTVQTESSQIQPSLEETDKLLDLQQKRRTFLLTVAATIILTTIAIFLFQYISTPDQQLPVSEVPFQEVIKENEQNHAGPAAADTSDTTKTAALPAPVPDSLVLKVLSTDSVWISIIRDSLPPRRGYLLNGRYRTYTAQDKFIVSFSDGGSIRLFLNGTELPSLAVKGKSVRNYILNRENLKK